MIGLLGGLISPFMMTIGGGALAALLWAIIERALRRRAASERDAWRARAEGAERRSEAAGRIASAHAGIDRRTEEEILRAGQTASARQRRIGEARGAEELAAETIRFFPGSGERAGGARGEGGER